MKSKIAATFLIVGFALTVGTAFYTGVFAQTTPGSLPPAGSRGGLGGVQTLTDFWNITTAPSTLKNGTALPVDFANQWIHNVNDPSNPNDLLNKQFSDTQLNAINNRIVALESVGSSMPTITSLVPLAVLRGQSLTITGTNLSTVNLVTFTGGATVIPSSTTATTVTANVPTLANSGPITVRLSSGAIAASPQSVTVYSPIIVNAVTPASSAVNTNIMLTGSGFLGVQNVKVGTIVATYSVGSDTSVTVTIPASTPIGFQTITVERTSAPITAGTIGFTVSAPVTTTTVTGSVSIASGYDNANVSFDFYSPSDPITPFRHDVVVNGPITTPIVIPYTLTNVPINAVGTTWTMKMNGVITGVKNFNGAITRNVDLNTTTTNINFFVY